MSSKSLVNQVRRSEIKQPIQRGFSPEKWVEAFESSQPASLDDVNLFNAGLWFNEKLESIRKSLASQSFAIAKDTAVRLHVGAVNFITKKLIQKSLTNDSPFLRRTENNHDVFTIPFALIENITMFISMLRYPLSKHIQDNVRISDSGLDSSTIINMLNFSFSTGMAYDTLESLWSECVWNNWNVISLENKDVIQPNDNVIERQRVIGEYRRESILFEISQITHNTWPELADDMKEDLLSVPRTVALQAENDKYSLIIGSLAGKVDSPPSSIVHGVAAEEIYFDNIISSKINPIGLSIREILAAWEILSSASELIGDALPDFNKLSSLNSFFRYSPLLSKSEIINIFKKYLNISEDKALFIINLFSFSGTPREDLWIKPLIPVYADFCTPIIIPMTSTNLLRLFDYWMRELGIDLSDRGPAFEQHVRDTIRDYNKIDSVEVYPKEITFKTGGFSEEIDLAIKIGNTILICEIKCSSQHSSPSELHRHIQVLHEGVEQIIRKSNFVKERVDEFIKQVNWTFDASQPIIIIACVLSNLATGCGLRIMDTPVVDLNILTKYFESDHVEQIVVMGPNGKVLQSTKRMLYTNAYEAEKNIYSYLSNPPQISILQGAIRESIVPILNMSPEDKPAYFYAASIEPPIA